MSKLPLVTEEPIPTKNSPVEWRKVVRSVWRPPEIRRRLSPYGKDGTNRWSIRDVPRSVLLLSALTTIASTVLFAIWQPAFFTRVASDPKGFIAFCAVAALLQAITIDIYERGKLSFDDTGLLAIGFFVHPAAAIALAPLLAFVRYLQGRLVYRIVFEASSDALAGGIGAAIYYFSAPGLPGIAKVGLILVSGGVFYVVNSGLITLALSLYEHTSPWLIWKERHRWAFPYFIAAALLAGGLILGYGYGGLAGISLFAIPPALMMISARQYVRRTEQGVKEVRCVNEKLSAANKSLGESEEHFRSLIEDATDVIIVIGREGRINYASPASKRLLGMPTKKIIGLRAIRLLSPGTVHQAIADISMQLNGQNEPFSLLLRRDQDALELECFVRAAEDQGLVVTLRDVTARKHAESAREELEQQLMQAQKMEAVGQLAGGIAHDFNNLLTVMMGCSELLAMQLDEDDSRRTEVEEITRAATRAAALTRQLLAFSRKQILEPTALDLNQIVADMEKMLQRLIGIKIRLRTELDSEVQPVFADPNQLEQILINLAVNARDAVQDKGSEGEVSISVRGMGALEARPGLLNGDDYIVLTVSDNGTGMNDETKAKIFEPFFTTKDVGKGTGLGLSTVYGIVQQTGGVIDVASRPGLGTAFHIYLPRYEGVIDDKQNRPQLIHGLAQGTILLVDDEDAVRRLATTALEEHGYRVLAARDGIDALEFSRAYSRKIDLLLADIVMPEMTGPALALKVRDERPETKVLFMSGHIADAELEGSDTALLRKPFFASGLLIAVQEALTGIPCSK